jgi:hypothetical protein
LLENQKTNLIWMDIIKNMSLTAIKYSHLPTTRC